MRAQRWVWWWPLTSSSESKRSSQQNTAQGQCSLTQAWKRKGLSRSCHWWKRANTHRAALWASPEPQQQNQQNPAQSGTVPHEWDEHSWGSQHSRCSGLVARGANPFPCPHCRAAWNLPALLLWASRSVLCCSAVLLVPWLPGWELFFHQDCEGCLASQQSLLALRKQWRKRGLCFLTSPGLRSSRELIFTIKMDLIGIFFSSVIPSLRPGLCFLKKQTENVFYWYLVLWAVGSFWNMVH